jgi:hypothetical protein
LSNAFNVVSSDDMTFKPQARIKDFHQNEWGVFFKDDWKFRNDLTINVGLATTITVCLTNTVD